MSYLKYIRGNVLVDLTVSLMNPTSALAFWGGAIGLTLGMIAIVVGIVSYVIYLIYIRK